MQYWRADSVRCFRRSGDLVWAGSNLKNLDYFLFFSQALDLPSAHPFSLFWIELLGLKTLWFKVSNFDHHRLTVQTTNCSTILFHSRHQTRAHLMTSSSNLISTKSTQNLKTLTVYLWFCSTIWIAAIHRQKAGGRRANPVLPPLHSLAFLSGMLGNFTTITLKWLCVF